MVTHVGQQFGNYRLLKAIGTGAFAEVYLGRHMHLETFSAVKVLHTQLSRIDVEKFRNEARMLVRLFHPYIIRVLDYGVEDTTPFLVMDYIPNGTLRQHHPYGTRVTLPNVVHYVTQIAAALQYAHDHQVIHRDVKPENMLVNRDNEIVLSDFGIAVFAQNTFPGIPEMAGTIAYMAPEQLQGRPCPASDQYALGMVVYEWLSGERPFRGSFAEIAAKQALVEPPYLLEHVPDLPVAVADIVHIALEKDPLRRFSNVRAFADALEQACKPSWYEPADIPTLLTQSIHPQLARRTGAMQSAIITEISARPDQAAPYQPAAVLTMSSKPSVRPASQPSPNTGEIMPITPSMGLEREPTRPLVQKATHILPTLPRRYRLLSALFLLLFIANMSWFVWKLNTPAPSNPTPTVQNIAGSYSGPLHNTRANIYATMTLTIQQKQSTINGDFAVGVPLLGNGQFTGNIDTTKHIRFLVHSADTSAPILFWGAIQPNGSLGGNYCSVNKNLKCDLQAGGRGVWSVIRTSN